MRTLIYPETEAFIKLKKQQILDKQQQQEEAKHPDIQSGRKKGVKRKDTPEEKRNKQEAKRARNKKPVDQGTTCKSCGVIGHSSAKSNLCINHNLGIQELIEQNIGGLYERYTVSLPLKSFISTCYKDNFDISLEKIKKLSAFLRKVIFRAQLFINYYILKYPENLSNHFFQQNFWYSVCRLVNKNMTIDDFLLKYSSNITHLGEAWTEINNIEGVNMTVDKAGLTNYGQVLSTACETIATCYNNFYIENFETIVSNYFIYMARSTFPDIRMAVIKYIVYNHVLDVVFSSESTAMMAASISSSLNEQTKDRICNFLNPLIVEIKNRLPSFPVTKETLNRAPFNIMPVLRHILEKYQSIIAGHQESAPMQNLPVIPQQQVHSQAQPETLTQTNVRPKKKKKSVKTKDPKEDKSSKTKFQPPRLFSLFPNPGVKWRFIKIDSQNLTGIFGRNILQKQAEERPFDFTQRSFFEYFNFKKLKIKSFEELQKLPHDKGKMFLNSMYTDGYTCRVSFCRKRYPDSSLDKVSLELDQFTNEDIDHYFRPCTVDPNRKDVFVSYHGSNVFRRLSSAEYYNMGGNINRQKLELERKKRENVEQVETMIPSPKTVIIENYKNYIVYMLQNFEILSDFYSFETARLRWCNYYGNQQAIEHAVNILINGSKKYNKNRRKKTKKNKRKRKKTAAKYHSGTRHINKGKNKIRKHKEKFYEGDSSKMPLVIYGNGLKNKSQVKFKGLRHGVADKLYAQLKRREKLGELLLLDIDEYNTSKTCNNCLDKSLENLKHDDCKIHQVLICKKCNIFWNRDVMASKNMFTISKSFWNGNGRPIVFQRQSATSNVVAAPSPVTA